MEEEHCRGTGCALWTHGIVEICKSHTGDVWKAAEYRTLQSKSVVSAGGTDLRVINTEGMTGTIRVGEHIQGVSVLNP